jgi:hypothetical protein
MRPDQIQICLNRLVGCIYDFNYGSFERDILAKFIDFDGQMMIRLRNNG